MTIFFFWKYLGRSSSLSTCRKGGDLIHTPWCFNLTVYRGDLNNNIITSKCHKNDEKHPTCSAHISFNFWNIGSKNTVQPDTFIECNSVVLCVYYFVSNLHRKLTLLLFGFQLSRKYSLDVYISILRIILVSNQKYAP